MKPNLGANNFQRITNMVASGYKRHWRKAVRLVTWADTRTVDVNGYTLLHMLCSSAPLWGEQDFAIKVADQLIALGVPPDVLCAGRTAVMLAFHHRLDQLFLHLAFHPRVKNRPWGKDHPMQWLNNLSDNYHFTRLPSSVWWVREPQFRLYFMLHATPIPQWSFYDHYMMDRMGEVLLLSNRFRCLLVGSLLHFRIRMPRELVAMVLRNMWRERMEAKYVLK